MTVVGLAVATSVIAVSAASAAAPAAVSSAPVASLSAPTGVKVARNAAKPNDFTVSWTAPTSGVADHYNVTVFADGQQSVLTAAGKAVSLSVTGKTMMSIYEIRVGARYQGRRR